MGILNIHTETVNTTTLFNELCTKEAKVAVVGLCPKGLSLALQMASKYRVMGYDCNRDLTSVIQQEKDPYTKVYSTDFTGKDFFATSIENLLALAKFYVITASDTNDTLAIKKSTARVARFLKIGDVVWFQNTTNLKKVMPLYISILEKVSGLQNNVDFKIGYSKGIDSISPSKKIIYSSDAHVSNLIHNLFNNITVFKVIKNKKPIDAGTIANKIKEALEQQKPIKGNYSILLKGITSKENTNSIKNSKAVALYMALYRKGIDVKIQDNHVLPSKVKATCGIELTTSTNQRFDAVVIAVNHDNYDLNKMDTFKKNIVEKTLFFDNQGNRKEVVIS